MTADDKVRGLRLYTFLLLLNETGRKRLQFEIEKQTPHHGHDTLNALIACVEKYLAREGE